MPSVSSDTRGMYVVDSSDMDTSSSPSPSPKLSTRSLTADATEEHSLYHFHDGSLAFELEGVKYRVHSSLLARHCGFASTWAQDLRNPIAAGISRADIDAFFSMIYLATYEYPELSLSAEKWTSVLRLAARWASNGMRALAVKMLGANLPPFDKLLLCRKYDVLGWLAPACAALALRPTPLTMVEAEQLEKSDIMRVFLAREAISKGSLTATEEAVSAWIVGFLSKGETPVYRAAASPPVSPPTAELAHSQPTISPFSSLSSQPSQLSQEEAAEVPVRDAEVSTSPSPSSEGVSPESQNASPSTRTSTQLVKASYASIAEAAPRPILNANASPFHAQSYATSSNTQQPDPSFEASHISSTADMEPIVPVRTPEEMISDAVDFIRAQRYEEALDSVTVDNVKIIASRVAPSLTTHPLQRPGTFDAQRLQHLLRAIMRRVMTNNGFMQRGAQFMAALSTRSSLRNIRFEVVLHDDMQSLSSRWATFRAGGEPAVDHGGIMVDLATNARTVYQNQMGHGRGFFRTLVRLGVLPATNKYVELLVQTYPSVANP